jgi:hypothetical protein
LNQNRFFGWLILGLTAVITLLAVLWTAAESGQLLPVTVALAALAVVCVGLYWVFSIAFERVLKAQAHLISQAMASTVSKSVEGGHIVIRHKSVVAEFIADRPAPAQIAAPAKRELTVAEQNIVAVLEATIRHEDYGADCNQILTADEARTVGVTGRDGQWQEIIKDMRERGLLEPSSNAGTFLANRQTALGLWKKIMA